VAYEDHTLPQQLHIDRQSTVIAGVHGAGLTHMVWMAKGAHVIEMNVSTRFAHCFELCFVGCAIGLADYSILTSSN
jgi:capsular polysaccharide biosynthesis protein